MATKASESGQGTGKHPHKSAAEPYPHTKENNQGKDAPKGAASEKKSSGGKSGAK